MKWSIIAGLTAVLCLVLFCSCTTQNSQIAGGAATVQADNPGNQAQGPPQIVMHFHANSGRLLKVYRIDANGNQKPDIPKGTAQGAGQVLGNSAPISAMSAQAFVMQVKQNPCYDIVFDGINWHYQMVDCN